MSDRIQMDLADARLLELLRSRERDIASQMAVMQMHLQQMQSDLQGVRSDFMTSMNELGQKYGVPLQHYNINPYTGEATVNPQLANLQHRVQSAMAQQAKKAGPPVDYPSAPTNGVPVDKDGNPPVPAAPGEVPAGSIEDGESKTEADAGEGAETTPEATEGEKAAD
jgi:hypothetical protein